MFVLLFIFVSSGEDDMRKEGYDKTPDIKLIIPVGKLTHAIIVIHLHSHNASAGMAGNLHLNVCSSTMHKCGVNGVVLYYLRTQRWVNLRLLAEECQERGGFHFFLFQYNQTLVYDLKYSLHTVIFAAGMAQNRHNFILFFFAQRGYLWT